MVKGVNKTVIEVNNTGSKMFEKIIFYVAPQYGNADPKRLQKAAAEFSFQFSDHGSYAPLRNRYRARRRNLIIGGLIASLLVLIVTLLLIL